jgi:hypothetical protein
MAKAQRIIRHLGLMPYPRITHLQVVANWFTELRRAAAATK